MFDETRYQAWRADRVRRGVTGRMDRDWYEWEERRRQERVYVFGFLLALLVSMTFFQWVTSL